MPHSGIECIESLTPKILQPAAGVGVCRESFYPILIPLWGSFEGHLQHLQALVYVGESCHMNSKGSESDPCYCKENVCNSVQGDHGVYLILFTYVWAINQLALILLKE